MIAVPQLEARDEAELLSQLRAKVTGYLGGWQPTPGGAGDGLLQVLAHFGSLVADGVNKAPDKNFLAFLDALGVTLLSPQAARAPLVFSLAPATPIDVPLYLGTEVAAQPPPPLPKSLSGPGQSPPAPSSPLIFSTDETITLSRAELAVMQSRVPDADRVADHTAMLGSGFTLFDKDRLKQITHHLYLGHDTLFDLPGPATIILQVALARAPGGGPTQHVALDWEAMTGSGWLPIDALDQTGGLGSDGIVELRKLCGPALTKSAVNGVQSFWVRARVKEPLSPPGADSTSAGAPVIGSFRCRVSFTHGDLPLDAASTNGFRLDTSKDFLPFGAQPALSTTFLIACDDAFRRQGARIDLMTTLQTPGADPNASESSKPQLALTWEFSSGPGRWTQLQPLDNLDRFTLTSTPDPAKPAISFFAPNEWAKTQVGGDSHYWLRVRISSGSYGGPIVYEVTGGEVHPKAGTVPKPPVLTKLTVSYTVDTPTVVPDHCLSLNGFTYEDHTEACRWGHSPFQPFQPLSDRLPAVYWGFDQPLPVGLISLYADVPSAGAIVGTPSATTFAWEYLSPDGWSELAVHDETGGFRQSGMIQFIGPPDLAPGDGPTTPLRWVRARLLTATAEPDMLPLNGLYLNAVWATQRTSVVGEVAGHSDGSPHQVVRLQHSPVLGQEKVEVQEWRGTGRDWQSLFQGFAPEDIRHDHDARGQVTGVWVRWQERPYLYSSGSGDRHYTVDRPSGLLRFGDGLEGMVPPPGAPISGTYDYGGGPSANVGPGLIQQMHSAAPYVQSVTNPVASGGGAAEETGAMVRMRGPQRILSLDRAVAASDYEWLAREASTELAVTRCLQATGPLGSGQPGWVTLVIAPWSDQPQPQPSDELMRRVRDHLASRAPAAVSGSIRISGPDYVPVSVYALVSISDASRAGEVSEALKQALDTFLHPLRGGPLGAGWAFGDSVHLSQVAHVIESTPGVDFAIQVQLSSDSAIYGDDVPVPPDRLPCAGRHLIKLQLES